MQAMIAQWGRTTRRVERLFQLGESSDEGGILRLNERGLPLCFSKIEKGLSANLVPNRIGPDPFVSRGLLDHPAPNTPDNPTEMNHDTKPEKPDRGYQLTLGQVMLSNPYVDG
jgi:hypothetical protein